eukprot:scaffold95216_cov68-Attheya_sp.AAC.3
MDGIAATSAPRHIFEINEMNPVKLDEDNSVMFHHNVAKLLFLCKRTRPNIQTAVAFLCTRVKSPDKMIIKSSLGKGSVYSASTKQKLNTKSSTESELIGVNDLMPQAQGYVTDHSLIAQDNLSAMLLENKMVVHPVALQGTMQIQAISRFYADPSTDNVVDRRSLLGKLLGNIKLTENTHGTNQNGNGFGAYAHLPVEIDRFFAEGCKAPRRKG